MERFRVRDEDWEYKMHEVVCERCEFRKGVYIRRRDKEGLSIIYRHCKARERVVSGKAYLEDEE